MNRKNLTAAVLAGLAGVVGIAGSAQAVNINPDGTGQVLLYPYYTTNAGNLTVLSVVNTSDNAKAVKVRFMESENSAEVLDFNLYMSAYDVWTAAIVPMPADAMYSDCDLNPDDDTDVYCEGPLLLVADDETTCTVPALNGAQPFLPFAYLDDDGTQDQSRANEGHFEMLEMGTLITDEATAGGDDVASWAGVDATHGLNDDTWKPADCGALVDAWTRSDLGGSLNGRWINDPTDGVNTPSGGLFGGAAIVNVMAGAMHPYNATAINGWNQTGFDNLGQGVSIHAEPGTVKPSLGSGDTNYGYVFSDEGDTLESGYVDSAWDAVSYVLMHDTLMNEYTTESSVAGETEWVVTFPTKRNYVNDVIDADDLVPFTTEWTKLTNATYATACETVELRTMWDREERTEPEKSCEELGNCPGETPPVVSPPRPGQPPEVDPARIPFELCYETNVIRFGAAYETDDEVSIDILPDATEILGSPMPNYRNIDNEALGFAYGWARIEMDDYLEATPLYNNDDELIGYDYEERSRYSVGDTDPLNGLPFVGFAVNRFANGFIEVEGEQTVFSSYGGLFKHKSSRKIGSDVAPPVSTQPVE
jgi:hypothetical protein